MLYHHLCYICYNIDDDNAMKKNEAGKKRSGMLSVVRMRSFSKEAYVAGISKVSKMKNSGRGG